MDYPAMEDLYLSSGNSTTDDTLVSQLQLIGLSPNYLLFPLILYPILVALLRRHRVRQTLEDFPYTDRRSFRNMTNEDAFYIQQILAELEFPFLYEKAMQFALFRTYGIPSISKLLVETGEFSEKATSTKRYTDTTVLVSEFAGYHPHNERSIEAVGRMNFIHHQYRKSGKIRDDDMLYTLALFACEPLRWINQYEWRQLEDFEKCAIGTFWKAMGDAMGIGYERLPGGGEGGEGWRDGLEWLEEITAWSQEYERECMVPDVNNHKTAEHTVAVLLWSLPNALKPVGKKAVNAVMDDRLRKAMMFERPPQLYFTFVALILHTRKYLLRHLFFPRPFIFRVHRTTNTPSKDGRHFLKVWETVPWYVKPTVWNRWFSVQSWSSWMMGLPIPGDDGDAYGPQGYKIHEIGPRSMRGKGEGYWREEKPRVTMERMKGCPFARGKVE